MATEMIPFEDDPNVAKDYGVDESEYIPEGYESVTKFLDHVTKLYDADLQYDKQNRDWAIEDLEFAAGDQWDPDIKQDREDASRPCMTINVLPQFIGQVVGDRRMNKTTIKVVPLKDGTVQVAEVRAGIIKGIEQSSRAERVYDAACEAQVTCGISNMRVDLEYAGNDVFDQDIVIRHIPNPLAVIWDRMSVDPTGRDARHCFVTDSLPKEVYEARFPDNPCPTGFNDRTQRRSSWWDGSTVQITEFWELVDKPARFAMMMDGDVKDVTGMDPAAYADQLWRHPATGETKERDSFRTYARMHMVTSFAILGPCYEIPLTRLPIIKVEGRVVQVGDDRVRFGLVRFSKDSQRLKNYWRSVAAEVLALAPKAQWHGPASAFEGREEAWTRTHITGKGPLIWNDKATVAPQRVDPPQVPIALLQEAQLNQQDIKDTTGLHDASLGMRSNEVSGKAIGMRQKEGDIATIIYHDNLNYSIQEVGDIANQLIPLAYDGTRTVLVIGVDDKETLQSINDPSDEESPDVTKGKYSTTLVTGPSFTTQRMEALDSMMTLLQTSPEMMMIGGDIAAKAMDWPGAHELAERWKKFISMKFPGLIEEDEAEQAEKSPEQLQAEMQEQQQAQQVQAAQQEQLQMELAEQQAKTAQAQANARAAEANANAAEANARAAQAKAEQAGFEARNAPREAAHKMRLAERAATAKGDNRNRGAGPRPAAKGSGTPGPKE